MNAKEDANEASETKAVAGYMTIPIGNRHKGYELVQFDWIVKFSRYLVAAGCAPQVKNPEAHCVIAIVAGLELGIAPIRAIESIAVINGRPSLFGDLPLGLVLANPQYEQGSFLEAFAGDWGNDDFAAVAIVARKGCKPISRSFSIADAKKAGLWGKAGTWTTYPRRMLQMRARSWLLRDSFADVLQGFVIAEEYEGVNLRENQAALVLPEQAARLRLDDEVVGKITDLKALGAKRRKRAASRVMRSTEPAEVKTETGENHNQWEGMGNAEEVAKGSSKVGEKDVAAGRTSTSADQGEDGEDLF